MDMHMLEQAGLTAIEAKVYVCLVELGPSLAGQVTRKSGIHRRSVYDAIERLMQKGLVSSVTLNRRAVFSAADPQRLLNLVEEKRESVQSILPHLQGLYGLARERQDVQFFRGAQALHAVFDDQVRERAPVLVINASVHASQIVRFYFERYDRERRRLRIPVRLLFDESVRANPYAHRIPLAKIRFLPKSLGSPTAVNVYAGKVAIILWSADPLAIVIANREIADSYRTYFGFLWKMAKE